MDPDQADRMKAWAHSARSLPYEIPVMVTESDRSLDGDRCPLLT